MMTLKEQTMSEDLLRRKDVIEAIHNYWKKRLDVLPTKESEWGEVYADIQQMDKILEHNKILCNFINAIPSADRPPGEWIDKGDYAECSNCGAHSGTQFDGVEPIPLKTNFCPNCGAMMKGADDED